MYWMHVSIATHKLNHCPYPGTLSETVKTKLVGDFSGVHGILEQVSDK